ncbi:MAG: replication-associated recombination protein A [Gammaproteobacteria bacterium]|nr:MAG: replication-associated recombination protein A [Gammaproteobacteria bacterium]
MAPRSTSMGEDSRPLADRMRPAALDEFCGQRHLLDEGKPLRLLLDGGSLHSMVLWGPPGTGKTTLARIVSTSCDALFIALSAVMAGVKDIRAAVEEARQNRQAYGKPTVLFLDEVHRFNKAQQDAFLPFVEDGTLVFIGATTENPSFELNKALLSRARVYVLKRLADSDLVSLLRRCLADEKHGLGSLRLILADEQLELIAAAADGDARRALGCLELASELAVEGPTGLIVPEQALHDVLGGSRRRFDKRGEDFYDQISALHKSVRGSDPDAALYWLCRMLDGGCDPVYLARRILRMASEDIGNADPKAMGLALNAWDAFLRLGSPEGELAIAQTVIYLASAPKSNAAYSAYKAAMADVRKLGSLEVPLHLRNAPTRLMKNLGYGKAYRYTHDETDAFAPGESYFPEDMEPATYYHPVPRGLEVRIGEKLDRLRKLNADASVHRPDNAARDKSNT